MQKDFDKVLNALKSLAGKKVLVLTHHNADVDAMASAVALAEGLKQLGAEAEVGAAESIAKPAQQIANQYAIIIDPDCAQYNFVILVETSVPEQLASVKNLRADMVIDHHPAGRLAGEVRLIDESAKATTIMVYKILKELGCKIDKELARIIAAGIVADTAHLRLANIEVFKIISELMETGFEFPEVLKLIEVPQDVSERVAALKAARRMEIYKFGSVIVAISNVGSHEAAAARALVKLGADIAIVVAEKEDETRISSRGRENIQKHGIDLSKIFQGVGKFLDGSGGGHALAGSANGKRKNRNELKKLILRLLAKKLGQWKKLE